MLKSAVRLVIKLFLSKFYVIHKDIGIFGACITFKIMIFMNNLKSLEISWKNYLKSLETT